MTATEPSEQAFPSTTWEYRKVKMRTPPAGHETARAQRGRWRGLSCWPRRRKIRLTISYRGGAESWWLLEARGKHGVFPGHAAIEDIMREVCSEAVWCGTDLIARPSATRPPKAAEGRRGLAGDGR